jgi:hypothetical protein
MLPFHLFSIKPPPHPPPYIHIPPFSMLLTRHIRAKHAPQWRWTNAECRQWIYLVCNHTLGLDVFELSKIADKLEGCGPNINCILLNGWE